MSKKQEYLTESYYYILLCLYKGLNYGYCIMQEAIKLLNNIVKIGSGTMYTAVSKMIKRTVTLQMKRMIEEELMK